MKRKLVIIILLAAFLGTSVQMPALAQIDPVPFMPAPGTMVHLSPLYTPAYLKGIVIHPENALKFDFIIYKGDKPLSDAQKREEYTKLAKYFLASLAIPDDDQWVNLSPYEKDKIIKDDFGKTEMGRDLLAQDYFLKQITASLIYPQDSLGKTFWAKVYAEAQKRYGTTNVPVNTFNKVWILPDDALIYEKGNTAYVLKNHLRVMLEQDYVSLKKHLSMGAAKGNRAGALGSHIIRQIVLPELEREVNEDQNFAPLRQVYSGMLLAAWFKRELKTSLLAQIYANKAKVKGIDQDPKTNEAIYRRYLQAYKKGVFNFIKDDTDAITGRPMPRKYFSGGTADYAMAAKELGYDPAQITRSLDPAQRANITSGLLTAEIVTVAMNEWNESDRQVLSGKGLSKTPPEGADAAMSITKFLDDESISPLKQSNLAIALARNNITTVYDLIVLDPIDRSYLQGISKGGLATLSRLLAKQRLRFRGEIPADFGLMGTDGKVKDPGKVDVYDLLSFLKMEDLVASRHVTAWVWLMRYMKINSVQDLLDMTKEELISGLGDMQKRIGVHTKKEMVEDLDNRLSRYSWHFKDAAMIGKEPRAILLEDTGDMSHQLRAWLEEQGYEVFLATGEPGLAEILKTHPEIGLVAAPDRISDDLLGNRKFFNLFDFFKDNETLDARNKNSFLIGIDSLLPLSATGLSVSSLLYKASFTPQERLRLANILIGIGIDGLLNMPPTEWQAIKGASMQTIQEISGLLNDHGRHLRGMPPDGFYIRGQDGAVKDPADVDIYDSLSFIWKDFEKVKAFREGIWRGALRGLQRLMESDRIDSVADLLGLTKEQFLEKMSHVPAFSRFNSQSKLFLVNLLMASLDQYGWHFKGQASKAEEEKRLRAYQIFEETGRHDTDENWRVAVEQLRNEEQLRGSSGWNDLTLVTAMGFTDATTLQLLDLELISLGDLTMPNIFQRLEEDPHISPGILGEIIKILRKHGFQLGGDPFRLGIDIDNVRLGTLHDRFRKEGTFPGLHGWNGLRSEMTVGEWRKNPVAGPADLNAIDWFIETYGDGADARNEERKSRARRSMRSLPKSLILEQTKINIGEQEYSLEDYYRAQVGLQFILLYLGDWPRMQKFLEYFRKPGSVKVGDPEFLGEPGFLDLLSEGGFADQDGLINETYSRILHGSLDFESGGLRFWPKFALDNGFEIDPLELALVLMGLENLKSRRPQLFRGFIDAVAGFIAGISMRNLEQVKNFSPRKTGLSEIIFASVKIILDKTRPQETMSLAEAKEYITQQIRAHAKVIAVIPEIMQLLNQKEYLLVPPVIKMVEIPSQDQAMRSAHEGTKGGIDLNSANLTLHIKRDGRGLPLPLASQDLAQLADIQGLDPIILSIKPVSQTGLFSELISRP